MSYKVELIETTPVCVVAEGPHWDVARQSLYFIDMYGIDGALHRYDLKENKTYSTVVPDHPLNTFIIPVKDKPDQFVTSSGKKILLVEWSGMNESAKVLKVLTEVEQNKPDTRFNDAKCDPLGRLFAGTMRSELKGDIFEMRLGTFYEFDGKQANSLKGNIGISNGLTWNVKTKKFFYIDSCDIDVKEYDYDLETGKMTNERVFVNFLEPGAKPSADAIPDGMTIDENGFLYVAIHGQGKIMKVNPTTAAIEMEIVIPEKSLTSIAFGGPNLEILFATAKKSKLYKITGLGVKGVSMNNCKLP